MVLLPKLTFLSLMLSLVVAKNIPETKHNIIRDVRMHVGVQDDGIVTDEEVELNYEQNYVRVSTPGRSDISPVVMIHDYNLNQTLYKANGLCFMFDVYDLPQTLHDWTILEEVAADGLVNNQRPDGYRSQLYRLLPFSLNRTSLPLAIQQKCPGEIKATVLQETLVQQEAYDYVHSNLGNKDLIMGEVFQPGTTTDAVRQKRQTGTSTTTITYAVIGAVRAAFQEA